MSSYSECIYGEKRIFCDPKNLTSHISLNILNCRIIMEQKAKILVNIVQKDPKEKEMSLHFSDHTSLNRTGV